MRDSIWELVTITRLKIFSRFNICYNIVWQLVWHHGSMVKSTSSLGKTSTNCQGVKKHLWQRKFWGWEMFHPAPSRHACSSPSLSTAGFEPGSIPWGSTIPFSGKRRFWKQQLPLNILLEARRLVKFLLGQPHSAQCQISSPILVPVLAPGDILLQSSRVAKVVRRCEMVQKKG